MGMYFDHSTDGQLKVPVIKYNRKLIDNVPQEITSTSDSPAADHLSNIWKESGRKLLPEKPALHFQHSVAQLLFLFIQAQPDL